MTETMHWALSPHLMVALTFSGGQQIRREHLERLREYLDVWLATYTVPRVAPESVGGVRVVNLLEPRRTG